jgi:hypothetical protein
MANATNFKMVNPTARVSLFLGFMDGPKVIGWAQQQAELLEHRVFGYIDDNNNFVAPTHPDNDEFVWNDMLQQFTRAFTHTTEADDAFIELQNCKMGERSPDEYIAEFNELSRKAHWDHDNRGTVELFKQGLPVIIHRRILGRDTIPQTMPQWQEQLRREVERSRLIQASTGAWRGGKEISAQGKTSSEESWTLALSQGETLAVLGQGTQMRWMLTESKLQDSLLKNAPNSMKKGSASTARNLGTSRKIAALANNKEEELLQDKTHRVDRVTKTIHRRERRPRQGLGPKRGQPKSKKW